MNMYQPWPAKAGDRCANHRVQERLEISVRNGPQPQYSNTPPGLSGSWLHIRRTHADRDAPAKLDQAGCKILRMRFDSSLNLREAAEAKHIDLATPHPGLLRNSVVHETAQRVMFVCCLSSFDQAGLYCLVQERCPLDKR